MLALPKKSLSSASSAGIGSSRWLLARLNSLDGTQFFLRRFFYVGLRLLGWLLFWLLFWLAHVRFRNRFQ